MDKNNITYDTKQYIVIKVDENLYALYIDDVDSIVIKQKITRVPKSQNYFVGVINLRGEIIPIISLRRRLSLSEDELTHKTRFIIAKTEDNNHIGLIVDEVKEVIELMDEDIEKVEYNSDIKLQSFSSGIGKHNNDLITILNVGKIVDDN